MQMEKMKVPTPEQIAIAHRYNIPIEQASTINIEKARAYHRNSKVSLEKFLDRLDESRLKHIEKQSIKDGLELLKIRR